MAKGCRLDKETIIAARRVLIVRKMVRAEKRGRRIHCFLLPSDGWLSFGKPERSQPKKRANHTERRNDIVRNGGTQSFGNTESKVPPLKGEPTKVFVVGGNSNTADPSPSFGTTGEGDSPAPSSAKRGGASKLEQPFSDWAPIDPNSEDALLNRAAGIGQVLHVFIHRGEYLSKREIKQHSEWLAWIAERVHDAGLAELTWDLVGHLNVAYSSPTVAQWAKVGAAARILWTHCNQLIDARETSNPATRKEKSS